MADEKRRYQKRRRAELEAETRRRITESAVELHGTLGPSRTSFSAVAERAGVRRSTLYRHFPDEKALFAACSAHWYAENPPPDLDGWVAVADPEERLRMALAELYAFYARTERMMENLIRDEETVPTVKHFFGAFHDYLAAARDVLLRGYGARGGARRRLAAAIGLALAFQSWRSLVREQGLDDAQAVELMARMVSAAPAAG